MAVNGGGNPEGSSIGTRYAQDKIYNYILDKKKK